MKKSLLYIFILLILPMSISAQVTVSGSNGADGNFTTLAQAFTTINSSSQTGTNIIITLTSSTIETSSAVLYGGLWSSLNIYPSIAGVTISGNISAPLIDLNGADNVTIDGRVMATGSTIDMTIINYSTSGLAATSTIRFINDATANVIRYCTIKGSESGTASGIIFFSTTYGTIGNNGNNIDTNNITGSSLLNRPVNAVFSAGTTDHGNNWNTIRFNNIYNNLNRGLGSNGIYLAASNSEWTISANSFYETTQFAPVANVPYYIIRINSTGTNFSIINNFIGGRAPECQGLEWNKTNEFNNIFYGIYLSSGAGTTSNIQNNTLRNISWSNALNGSWTGIHVAGGDVNIGTITGNTIGDTTGTGSLLLTSQTTSGNVYGINIASPGTVDCQNNKIGSIIIATSEANSSNFYGINKTNSSGNTTISNNVIGSTSTTNSIIASSQSTGNAQSVRGIYNAGTGIITISNNTIANLNNNTSNIIVTTLGKINGIFSSSGVNAISGNIIHDLTIANANSQTTLNASISGISLSGPTVKNVTNNIIYNLSNTYTSFTGSVTGLFFTGSTVGNTIAQNLIHSLTVSSSSTAASIVGIRVNTGSSTYANNIIALGGNTSTTIYGIYEGGLAGTFNNLYFNTVSICGSPTSETNKSYALYSSVNRNTRNFRNNIFVNTRSTSGGTNLHYALYFASTGGTITCSYNDYFVSGTGGRLGYYGGNKLVLPIVTGQDGASQAANPEFSSICGTAASDYWPGVLLQGVDGTGISTDFGLNPRVVPIMGAWEIYNKWKGSVSIDWNTPGNWTGNRLPSGTDPSIFFDANPDRPCYLDQDRSVTNITNGQLTDRLVTNGHKLTVKGTLNFTNGAQIEASAASSTVEFAGIVAQSIPSGAFYNDQVYDLIINNANNVTLNGTLNLLNNSSATSGVLDAHTNSPTFIYGGTSAQTIAVGTFLDSTLFNLTIDNSNGVTLNSLIKVTNTLTLNSNRIFSVNPTGRATINTLVNNGILNLNSSSASDIFSMIIDNYSGSGTTNAQLYLTGGGGPYYNWHYVAEPFLSGIPTSFLTNINARNLLSYDDARVVTSDYNGWMYFNGYAGTSGIAGGLGFTTLDFGKGYNFYNGTNATATFTGSTAIGTTLGIIPLKYSGSAPNNAIYGLNLLGNSLTCSIDWDLVTRNGSVGSAVYYTIGNQWATYIPGSGGTNGGTKNIPPLQGFFVKASAQGASIDLSNAREHSFQPRYKKSGNQEMTSKSGTAYPKIKLELSGTETSDETIVWYPEDATTGFDEKFDANKMFASESVFSQIYSIMEGQNYVINGMPLPTDSMIVPLGVKFAKPGAYSLLKTDYVAPDGYDILLIDKANNNFTVNLKNNDEYQFSAEAGTFTDRFFLKILSVLTEIEDPEIENKDFNIYGFQGIVNIVPMNSTIYSSKGEIRIFDLTGRVIKQIKNVEWYEGTPVQVPSKDEHGIYLVEITSGAKRFVGKVFLP